MESKSEDLISTADLLSNIQFSDIFDLEEIQRLQDLFADANNIASIITTTDGIPITKPRNFTKLCNNIIRKTEIGLANCYKSDAAIGKQNFSGPIIQPCMSCGLWDAGVSITVGGKHIANWLIGQVLNDNANEQQMMQYADEIGANRVDFLEALHHVPIMSVERFNNISKLLFAFVNALSEKAYNNLRLKIQISDKEKANKLLRESEERFQLLFNKAPLGYQSLDINGNFIDVNQHWLDTFGYRREEVIGKWFGDFLTPAYKDYFINQFSIFIDEGKIHSEYEMAHKNGNLLFIAMDGKIGHDSNGNFKQTHGILQDITQRRKAEQALNESEELHRITIGSIHDPVFITDDTGAFTFICPNILKVLGYTVYEIKQMGNISGLVGEYLFDIADLNAHEIIDNIERTIKDMSGIERIFQITVSHVNIQGGTILWVFHDVTELKRAGEVQKEIEQSKSEYIERLNEAQKIASIGSWEWNLQTNHVWWSAETYRIFGVSAENFVPSFEANSKYIHPDDLEKYSASFEHSFQTGVPLDVDIRLIDNSDKLKYCQVKGGVIRDNSRQPIRFIGTINDITASKLAQETLYTIEEKLHDTYLYVRSLIEASLDPLVTINVDGKITDVNSATEKVTGISRNHLIGTDFSDYFTEPQKARTGYQEVFEKGYVIDYPLTICHTSGQLTDVLYNASVYQDKNGIIVGVFAAARDITLRKQAEAEIQRKNEELLKNSAEKDKFFSIIAHDLKSPFNGFIGLTDLMVEKMSSMNLDEIHELAKIMRTSANNLFRLLGNLLEWSRMQRGLTTFNPSQFLLMPIMTEALVLVLDGADKKKIVIMNNIPEDLEVFADANMLGLIIRNLVTNAVKFTPTGGSITISAKTSSDQSVEFSVKDTGIGMNAYMVDNLFRLDINTSRKGTDGEYSTGLGLMLSKDFVEKHKGKLWVESEEGKGSDFRFILPGNLEFGVPKVQKVWSA